MDQSPQCQYKFDLLSAGLEDGPTPIPSISDRRTILKHYADNWDNLKWTELSSVRMERGGLWELFGGVLAQNTPSRAFTFTRLPGLTRGIQEKTWTAEKPSFRVRDFGMDPAQDLWVVIEKRRQYVSLQCFTLALIITAEHKMGCSRLRPLYTKCTSYLWRKHPAIPIPWQKAATFYP